MNRRDRHLHCLKVTHPAKKSQNKQKDLVTARGRKERREITVVVPTTKATPLAIGGFIQDCCLSIGPGHLWKGAHQHSSIRWEKYAIKIVCLYSACMCLLYLHTESEHMQAFSSFARARARTNPPTHTHEIIMHTHSAYFTYFYCEVIVILHLDQEFLKIKMGIFFSQIHTSRWAYSSKNEVRLYTIQYLAYDTCIYCCSQQTRKIRPNF